MPEKLQNKKKNLERALAELREYCAIEKPKKVEMAGTIQGVEFTPEVF